MAFASASTAGCLDAVSAVGGAALSAGTDDAGAMADGSSNVDSVAWVLLTIGSLRAEH